MPPASSPGPSPDHLGPGEVTRLGFDRTGKAWVVGVCAAVGLLLGLAIRPVAESATGLDWVPFQGPLRLIASADHPWVGWLLAVLGIIAGLVFAAVIIHQSPVLHVGSDQIRVDQKGQVRTIRRAQVATVYRDGSDLVLETEQGRTLFRGDVEGGKGAVREAFIARGYPWDAEPS
ncbi:YqeB family protein [Ornithinimicrobium cryptoxanthini]|uniref:YqeB PH domain-containing protein n=1 Tax=Ornithinimicrobium cryptoxanthini TaxID=2934161 RepID=A0ABY4YH50_9MICO|nr:hypothetical protein [Ornithinimicrobium cryptoxanthini]USQ75934.1 hypothetical protein NF557_15250 [Ornithinimicrobium cryptoxanthini]